MWGLLHYELKKDGFKWQALPFMLLMLVVLVYTCCTYFNETLPKTAKGNVLIKQQVEAKRKLDTADMQRTSTWLSTNRIKYYTSMSASEQQEYNAIAEYNSQLSKKQIILQNQAKNSTAKAVTSSLSSCLVNFEDVAGWRALYRFITGTMPIYLLLFSALIYSSFFAQEWQHGVQSIMGGSLLGGRKLARLKISLALLLATGLFWLVLGVSVTLAQLFFDIYGNGSISFHYLQAGSALSGSLRTSLFLIVLFQYVQYLVLVLFLLLISQFARTSVSALMGGFVFALAPSLLSILLEQSAGSNWTQVCQFFLRLFPSYMIRAGELLWNGGDYFRLSNFKSFGQEYAIGLCLGFSFLQLVALLIALYERGQRYLQE